MLLRKSQHIKFPQCTCRLLFFEQTSS